MASPTIDGNQFRLPENFPDGSSVVGYRLFEEEQARTQGTNSQAFQTRELARLLVFRSDLERVIRWCALLADDSLDIEIREASAIAAFVRLSSCFEGTAGLRTRPLKSKILAPDLRERLKACKNIRNQMIAHDDNTRPGTFVMLVLGPNADALRAYSLNLSVPISGLPAARDLIAIADAALAWIAAEYERVASRLVDGFNELPPEERQRAKAETPPFSINIVTEGN